MAQNVLMDRSSQLGFDAEQNQQALEADQVAEYLKLAGREDKAVRFLRVVVIGLLIAAAILLSASCGFYLRHIEYRKFRLEFEASADKIIDSVYVTIQRKMESLDTLSAAFTSFAETSGAVWPNVTLPDYTVRAAGIRVLAESPDVNTYHLVTDENRDGWEAYVRENQNKRYEEDTASEIYHRNNQDAFFMQPNTSFPIEPLTLFNSGIMDLNTEDGSSSVAQEDSGPYLAGWHFSPVSPLQSVINFNAFSFYGLKASAELMMRNHKAILGLSSYCYQNLGRTGEYFRSILSLGQYRYDASDVTTEPTATLIYPIFDSFVKEERKVVAMITVSVLWKLYFLDVLPSTMQGIMCVISNSVGQTFSYKIDGKTARYYGEGDLHNPKFEHMGKVGFLSEYNRHTRLAQSLSFTSVPVIDEFDYKIEIYPCDKTASVFLTNIPWAAALVVAMIFIFTGAVFVTYSLFVDRRQGILMKRAIASGAIVSSFFPSQVRDKIYKEKEAKIVLGNDTPIADKFDHTSIIFADLKGFTSWSSNRSPEHVFMLLEALYGAFDKIAFRMGVFKVETIGDCYVAVTGLPKPQEDHAVIMCRFAEACMAKMSHLIHGELSDKLGRDTENLMLRIGIHSGSVTAGVLRGDKGRFQLFGDCVNVSSRMESTGAGGRIQVSQSTKDELVAHGKESWIRAREDIVNVKGKGETRTYWLLPGSTTSSRRRPSSTTTAISSGGLSTSDNHDVLE